MVQATEAKVQWKTVDSLAALGAMFPGLEDDEIEVSLMVGDSYTMLCHLWWVILIRRALTIQESPTISDILSLSPSSINGVGLSPSSCWFGLSVTRKQGSLQCKSIEHPHCTYTIQYSSCIYAL